MLVMSYMPLFNVVSTNFEIDAGSVDGFLKAAEASSDLAVGKGVLWIRNDEGVLLPVFIYEEGDDIVDHLIGWSEDKPEDWFEFHVVELESDGKIEFLVSPKYRLSIDRHKRQHPGIDWDNQDVKVLFTPLSTRVEKSDQVVDFLNNIKPVVKIGFIDFDYLRFGDPSKLNLNKIIRTIDLSLTSVENSLSDSVVVSLFRGERIARDYGGTLDR